MTSLAVLDAEVPPMTEHDRQLRVERRRVLAEGVVELVLASDTDLPEWGPGAHVDLVLSPTLVRQYSLCGDPADRRRFVIGVLRDPHSRGGSAQVHDELVEGHQVTVRAPRNHFSLQPSPRYVFIAGGIGITPILAMITAAERAGADWRLLYGGRQRASMAYLDALARYGDHVHVQPEDEAGRLDIGAVLDRPAADTLIYCCGPEPLLDAVQARASAWPAGSLHLERFNVTEIDHSTDIEFEVVFERSGVTATVPAGVSILDVAIAHDVFVLRSCSEGICGTCETVLLDGEPEHRDSVLSDEDRDCGSFMPCVSRCTSARLVLDL